MKFNLDDRMTPLMVEVLNNATADSLAKAQNLAREASGMDFWLLTFGDFLTLQTGDLTPLRLSTTDEAQMTVGDFLLCKAWPVFVVTFAETLKRLTPTPTPDERAASSACLDVDFNEAMYVFLRKYFNLHSFREAEGITLADIVMAKKAEYNEIMYQRKQGDLMKKKIKQAKK